MAFTSHFPLFKSLTDEQEADFRKWARENDPPARAAEEWTVYHPVIRDEWRKAGKAPAGAVMTAEELGAQ
jgi:hypothetical protein